MSKVQTAVERAKALRGEERKVTSPAQSRKSSLPNQIDPTLDFGGRQLSISSLPRIDIDLHKLRAQRVLTHDDSARHPAQNAYRMLRTRLMQVMRANNWRILGVSSIRENEGKTFTSINLAISIAAEIGQEVLLVDLDLRKPSVIEYFGLDSSSVNGLKSYLEDKQQDLDHYLFRTEIEGMGLLLSTDPIERSSDILASERGHQLFAELRNRLSPKSVIVLDLPPLLAADDALAIAPMLDAMLLVVAEGQTERTDITEVRHQLEAFNVIGTVLNKSEEKESKRKSYYY